MARHPDTEPALPVRDQPQPNEDSSPRAMRVFGGRYRLERPLGRGGMGELWQARHLLLGHEVAVKLMRAPLAGPAERRRFESEARLSATLGERTAHIARVWDFGIEEDGDGVIQWFAMELLRGSSLAEWLAEGRRASAPMIATVSAHLAEALGVTHAAGIVHRDIKPSNIFWCDGPPVVVKLLDFGIAKGVDDGLTRPGTAIGTPGYMAPEQVTGERLDARADVFSFGVVIYQLLTGQKPFGRGSFEEVTARILWATPPRPTELRAELPSAIDDWMNRALAKNPAVRYASIGAAHTALASALCAWTGGEEPAATETNVARASAESATEVPAAASTVRYTAGRPAPPSSRRRWLLIGGIVAAGLGLLGATMGFGTQRNDGRGAPAITERVPHAYAAESSRVAPSETASVSGPVASARLHPRAALATDAPKPAASASSASQRGRAPAARPRPVSPQAPRKPVGASWSDRRTL